MTTVGYTQHWIITAVTADHRPGGLPDFDAYRASLPEELRHLAIGPVPSAVNGYVTYVLLPSGSKSGFGTEIAAQRAREAFKALFSQRYEDGSTSDEVIEVVFGGDYSYEAAAGHIARWDPSRVLAEVEAKRARIDLLEQVASGSMVLGPSHANGEVERAFALRLLYLDAQPLASRPGFNRHREDRERTHLGFAAAGFAHNSGQPAARARPRSAT